MYYAKRNLVDTRATCSCIAYCLEHDFQLTNLQAYRIANWVYGDYAATQGDVRFNLEVKASERFTLSDLKRSLTHIVNMGSRDRVCFAERMLKLLNGEAFRIGLLTYSKDPADSIQGLSLK